MLFRSQPAEPASTAGDAETQKLAESIAQDASQPPESRSTSQSNESETSYEMHESRVPSSRFGRLWQYGGLATSMAFGAVGESFRRFAGGSSEGSVMMSEGNMNRLVAKLSRMRGAALKLGQMMSFQGKSHSHIIIGRSQYAQSVSFTYPDLQIRRYYRLRSMLSYRGSKIVPTTCLRHSGIEF